MFAHTLSNDRFVFLQLVASLSHTHTHLFRYIIADISRSHKITPSRSHLSHIRKILSISYRPVVSFSTTFDRYIIADISRPHKITTSHYHVRTSHTHTQNTLHVIPFCRLNNLWSLHYCLISRSHHHTTTFARLTHKRKMLSLPYRPVVSFSITRGLLFHPSVCRLVGMKKKWTWCGSPC